ncbi:alpha/beta fold hydrolase [Hymenobacter psychrophilus]|uniref:Pimeloyl-ACP methyl ester carboxylesterase n=1 Tax=Hymenobacter psychrophilus TaxID=651662 RepID=A0A1H3EUT3_9BACT|nr:alpha/beta hydrolase [Hymenobacter psychrophilus]SDX81689.1 Pimeloyl-ACP methyl ester carboxylesterase [Hymenobacter psychrophilus]
MQRALLATSLFCLTLTAPARSQQVLQQAVVDGIAQKVDAKPYAGLPYRLTARISVDTAQAGKSDAWIMVSAWGAKQQFLTVAYLPEKAVEKQWRVYTVRGKVPKQVDSLEIAGLAYLDGPFGFDDFKLEVERRKGQWEPVLLRNSDFEGALPASAMGIPAGWRSFYPTPSFVRQVATDGTGNRYFSLRGLHIVNYGRNPAAGRFATVNGTRIYYETYGQGEPLLLLHGNGESISSFRQQLGALAREYRVIAVDTRDQGQSAATKGRLSYDLFADDMHALLEQLQVPAAHVVGWSDGGNTGLSMALRYPAQVRSLVTMGANLYADTTAVDPEMLQKVRKDRRMATLLSPFNQNFRKARRLNTMLLNYPQMTPVQLRTITAPVLVLAGEKDIIREAHTRLIAQNIPRGEVIILPGLTHYAPQGNGPLFNETVLAFLRRQRSGQ